MSVVPFPSLEQVSDNPEEKKRTIFKSNISYEPLYNDIYTLNPKVTNDTDLQFTDKEDNIFNLNLSTILRNMANAILLVLVDLLDIENYNSLWSFLKIFAKENRLMYLGIFIMVLSIFQILFMK
jgi:hypothetical protein